MRRSGRIAFSMVLCCVCLAPRATDAQAVFSDSETIEIKTLGGVPEIVFTDDTVDSSLWFNFDTTTLGLEWALVPITQLTLHPPTSGDQILVYATSEGGLDFRSEGDLHRHLADADNDSFLFSGFVWYSDILQLGNRVMQLQRLGTDDDLFIAGTLPQNTMFDLAEAFWETEHIEPGDLVEIDPNRSGSVRLARGAYSSKALGVVSTRPGIVLGGGAFSVEALRASWGDEIAAQFEQQRVDLRFELFAENPGMRAEAERYRSLAAFRESRPRSERLQDGGDGAPAGGRHETGFPTPEVLRAAYEKGKADFEMSLDDLAMQRFFEQRFAAVALAGRVPAKVDASFGAIEPGDFLTSSPRSGLAMKASRPGVVIGTALEALASGTSTIEVLVNRTWYGGQPRDLGSIESPALGSPRAVEEAEIAELRERLRRLEQSFEDRLVLAVAETRE